MHRNESGEGGKGSRTATLLLDIISKDALARSAATTCVRALPWAAPLPEEEGAASASPSGMVPDILRWWPKLLRVLKLPLRKLALVGDCE